MKSLSDTCRDKAPTVSSSPFFYRHFFREALGQCTLSAPIGQAAVMAGDAVRSDQCSKAIRSTRSRQLLDFLRPSRCVIRARPPAGDVVLKLARVFSNIMKKSNDGTQARCSEFIGSRRSQHRYGFQMRRQRLPCVLVATSNRMGEEHVRFHGSSNVQQSYQPSATTRCITEQWRIPRA
jgi:hypothetical protein